MIVWAEGRREDSFHLVSNSILLINDVVNDGSTLPDRLAGCTWDWPIGRRGGYRTPLPPSKAWAKGMICSSERVQVVPYQSYSSSTATTMAVCGFIPINKLARLQYTTNGDHSAYGVRLSHVHTQFGKFISEESVC